MAGRAVPWHVCSASCSVPGHWPQEVSTGSSGANWRRGGRGSSTWWQRQWRLRWIGLVVTGAVWSRSVLIGRCVGGELCSPATASAPPASSEAASGCLASCACASRSGVRIFGSTDCVHGVSGRHADEGTLGRLPARMAQLGVVQLLPGSMVGVEGTISGRDPLQSVSALVGGHASLDALCVGGCASVISPSASLESVRGRRLDFQGGQV